MSDLNNNLPPVSVLLPVYNGEGEIHETVGYILRQTFSDFELLIIDDGSTDNTWDQIQKLATQDKRIKIFQNPQNQGVAKSTITIANKAVGSILIKEDCGDFSAPDRYQIQYDLLTNNPDASACVTDFWLVDLDNSPLGIRHLPSHPEDLANQVKIANYVAHSSFAMRKSVYDEIGGYDSELFYSLDYDMLLKLMKAGPVLPINKPLVACKYNPRGITFSNREKQAAYADLVKFKHFGGTRPKNFDFKPLSVNEAEASFHRMAGLIHLTRGRTRNARNHFKSIAEKTKPGLKLTLLQCSTWVPGPLIRAVQKLRGRSYSNEADIPFYLQK